MLVYMSNINVKDHINSFYQSHHVHVMYQIREPKRHPKISYVQIMGMKDYLIPLLNIYQVWEFSVHLKHRTQADPPNMSP